ncbi:secreted protein [Melampsora americana]|nr:secreted protein [Melampsora americana]
MFFKATTLSLFAFCLTSVICLGEPIQHEIICKWGYRVRPDINGKSQGMCTIANITDDYACEGCKRDVPTGVGCVEGKFDIPYDQIKKSKKEIPCPNYERLEVNGQFVGFGCANAREGQKARCNDIKNRQFCPKGACRLNTPF